ncbi:UxaA family hydrolase [Neptunomonas japonica]|uniref:Galactarate dehydratase n=1 Tax=Neptunomonas japonica JAMM 1380 TaxID=1441457 RepID=A0A7R6PIE1_9GAMM|nr:altronate dehydratase family protein [Neptunomonas japonica]BBB29691.1 galactarate dehydratase [Neptunomonas japonica JAMM 1380]
MSGIKDQEVFRLSELDNVVVAKSSLREGKVLLSEGVTLNSDVSAGHKIATHAIPKNSQIVKYGTPIGIASQSIRAGDLVHTNNCEFKAFKVEQKSHSKKLSAQEKEATKVRSFNGFVRTDNQVGTRNYIGILTTVNCAGSVARMIDSEVNKKGLLDKYPNVDGVVVCVHNTGCGMGSTGDGFNILNRTIQGYSTNPNFSGILLLSLGCEVYQSKNLLNEEASTAPDSSSTLIKQLGIQNSGGTEKSIKLGIELLISLLEHANQFTREKVPLSKLKVGLQCGASDGYSGISANPALGKAADLLVEHGATAILSETTEIYGAEHLLIERARNKDVADQIRNLIDWWEKYTVKTGNEIDNNPSPGNKAGGLTTILEKSLGAVSKSGSTPLTAVYSYAEKITEPGLVFMDSPGFDPCAVTGQIAAGANLICFTTGRGSVFGSKPSPTIKISSNSDLYKRLSDDIDINCGKVIDGELTISDMGLIIFEEIIRIASGEKTKSEKYGFGNEEFVPWNIGAVV